MVKNAAIVYKRFNYLYAQKSHAIPYYIPTTTQVGVVNTVIL